MIPKNSTRLKATGTVECFHKQQKTQYRMLKLSQTNQDMSTFDFKKLKLVDKPDADLNNAKTLPQTLEGCEGYLKELPLQVKR